MTTFIYKEIAHHKRTRDNRELTIYRIKDNTPQYIGTVEFTTGSTRGAKHEAFNFLMDNGYIPKNIITQVAIRGRVRVTFTAKLQNFTI